MQQTIPCEICGQHLRTISWNHLKKHNLSLSEYKKQFPSAPIKSEAAIQTKLDSAKRANNLRKGVPRSQSTKDKISKTKLDNPKPAWNKGIPMSEDQKSKLSTIKADLYATGEILHWNTGHQTPQHVKDKISRTALSQDRTYSVDSNKRRNVTYETKRKHGWVHHSTLNQGKPSNMSDEAKLKLSKLSKQRNLKRMELSESRIISHLSEHQLELMGVDNSRYLYELKCNVCDTLFTRTKSVLTPYRYEFYCGEYCPECYPQDPVGYYCESFFKKNPILKDHTSFLYIVNMYNESDNFGKIGITKNEVTRRLTHLSATHIVDPLYIIPMKLYDAFSLEYAVLQDIQTSNISYTPTSIFGGSTECFNMINLDQVLQSIENLIPDQYLN